MAARRAPTRCLLPVLAALAAGAALLGPAIETADARMSVLYEGRQGQLALLGALDDDPRALDKDDNVFQQQPANAFLNRRAFQAAKVTGSGAGTEQSPTLEGKDADEIVSLLTQQITRRNYDGVVFIDELRPTYRDAGADALRDALRTMAGRPSTTGEQNLARQVHIYVPAPELSVAEPDRWAGAWDAMALAGGVWLEAYRKRPGNRLVWRPEEWLTYGRTFPAELARRGGDPARVHFLMTSPEQAATTTPIFGEPVTQAEQWRWARSGGACATLANGPGTWRVAAETRETSPEQANRRADAFLAEFRSVFGNAPAPIGPQAIDCLPAPATDPARAERVAAALRGAPESIPATVTTERPLTVGAEGGRITVDLGPDPAGIATALGVTPTRFWRWAGARVVLRAPGDAPRARPVGGLGRARFPAFAPPAAGSIAMSLVIPGLALQREAGTGPIDRSRRATPVDLAAALEPYRAEIGPIIDTIARRPNEWRLAIPVAATIPVSDAVASGAPPTVIRLARIPNRRVRSRWKRDPRRFAVTRIVATRGGVPASFARVTVRGPGARSRVVATPANGVAFLISRRTGGTISAEAPGVARPARLRLGSRIVAAGIGLRELGAARVRAAGRDPDRWRRIVVLVRRRGGGTVPFQPLRVRYGPRGGQRTRTNAGGVARIWIRRGVRGPVIVRTADAPRITARRVLR
jgi:hypothetical protein